MVPKQTGYSCLVQAICGPFAIKHDTDNLHLPDARGNSWKVDLSKTGITCMFKHITAKPEKVWIRSEQNRVDNPDSPLLAESGMVIGHK